MPVMESAKVKIPWLEPCLFIECVNTLSSNIAFSVQYYLAKLGVKTRPCPNKALHTEQQIIANCTGPKS